MSDEQFVYSGFKTVVLNGASQGIIDLGETRWRKISPQLDMATNAGYRVYLQPCRGNSAQVFSTGAQTRFGAAVAGADFANQPSSEHLHIASASTADVTQTITIYGVTSGTTVIKRSVKLNGTTTVNLYPDVLNTTGNWTAILAWELDAATAGNVTVAGSTAGTIFTVTAGVLSAGVTNVTATSQEAFGLAVRSVAGGASTKYVGIWGETSTHGEIGELITLNGTTAVFTVENFNKVTKLLVGDVASTSSLSIGLYGILNSGVVLTSLGADKKTLLNPHRYLLWSCYNGTSLTAAGAADRLDIELYG